MPAPTRTRSSTRPSGKEGTRCIFFDDLIVAWSNDLFALALASLSLEDGESFISNITSGGLDTLQALFRLGRDAFALGREVGALYRDTLELEVVVWLDDEALAEETAGLREAYANGNGPLVDWKAELDRLEGPHAGGSGRRRAGGRRSGAGRHHDDATGKYGGQPSAPARLADAQAEPFRAGRDVHRP